MRLIPAAFSQGPTCAHRRPCRGSRLRTVSSLPLTRTLPHPAGLLARPAPRSSREAQQRLVGSRPSLVTSACLLSEALQGEGTRRYGVPVPTPFSRVAHPGNEHSTVLMRPGLLTQV